MSVDIALLPWSSSSSVGGEPLPPFEQTHTPLSSTPGSQSEDPLASSPQLPNDSIPDASPLTAAPAQPAPQVPTRPIAIEVDGPRHFQSNEPTRELGHTLLRNYILRSTGWIVISVNLQSAWEYLSVPDKRKEYLCELLKSHFESLQPPTENQSQDVREAVIDIGSKR